MGKPREKKKYPRRREDRRKGRREVKRGRARGAEGEDNKANTLRSRVRGRIDVQVDTARQEGVPSGSVWRGEALGKGGGGSDSGNAGQHRMHGRGGAKAGRTEGAEEMPHEASREEHWGRRKGPRKAGGRALKKEPKKVSYVNLTKRGCPFLQVAREKPRAGMRPR